MDAAVSLDDDFTSSSQHHESLEIILPETWFPDPNNSPISLLSSTARKSEILASTDTNTETCQRCNWDQRRSTLFPADRNVSISGFNAQQVTTIENCIRCRILTLLLKALGQDYQSPFVILIIGTGCNILNDPYGDYEDFDLFFAGTSNGVPSWFPRGNTTRLSYSSSVESLEWTRREIDNCLKFHACCRSEESSFMPTRLINIRPRNIAGDSSSRMGPQSLLARDIVPSAIAGAMSSRIVSRPRPRLRSAKLIPWSTLPQTFQDTIHWARSADVDYLWIDSVCILQGDRDDWVRESGRMFQVYQNSYVTIVATFGKDPTSDLFSAHSDGPEPKPFATLRRASTG